MHSLSHSSTKDRLPWLRCCSVKTLIIRVVTGPLNFRIDTERVVEQQPGCYFTYRLWLPQVQIYPDPPTLFSPKGKAIHGDWQTSHCSCHTTIWEKSFLSKVIYGSLPGSCVTLHLFEEKVVCQVSFWEDFAILLLCISDLPSFQVKRWPQLNHNEKVGPRNTQCYNLL